MELLESGAYIALGFVPTLAILESAYRFGMKIKERKRKGVAVSGVLFANKVVIPNSFQDVT
jgi:hydrogenase/urease accessory protein HupE